MLSLKGFVEIEGYGVFEDTTFREVVDMVEWLRDVANNSENREKYHKIGLYFGQDINFFHHEARSLQKLTSMKCPFTPVLYSSRIVASGRHTDDLGIVSVFYITEVVMSRISGVTLGKFLGGKLTRSEVFPVNIPDIAIQTTVVEMYNILQRQYHATIFDKHADNVMIDKNRRLWLVDFEF